MMYTSRKGLSIRVCIRIQGLENSNNRNVTYSIGMTSVCSRGITKSQLLNLDYSSVLLATFGIFWGMEAPCRHQRSSVIVRPEQNYFHMAAKCIRLQLFRDVTVIGIVICLLSEQLGGVRVGY